MAKRRKNQPQSLLTRCVPAWLLLGMAFLLMLPGILNTTVDVIQKVSAVLPTIMGDIFGRHSGEVAPLFTPQIQHWSGKISEWSDQYDVDPNLMATIMQIESCGHPTVVSHAGAQGLFQVMPFHFASDENMVDPDTNARRSAKFINECTGYANGDVGLTLACYNGGPSVTRKPYHQWHSETQRYYVWGLSIYTDSQQNLSSSPSLNEWLNAGGKRLCDSASREIGLR